MKKPKRGAGRKKKIPPIIIKRTVPIRLPSFRAAFAPAGFSFPSACPVMAAAAAESPVVNTAQKLVSRSPIPNAATGAVPKEETIRIRSIPENGRVLICPAAGRLIRAMSRKKGLPREKMNRNGGTGPELFDRSITARSAPVRLPRRVASPAPAIPISGKGPIPKMRRGSNIMFTRFAAAITIRGILVLPHPWNTAPEARYRNRNTEPNPA